MYALRESTETTLPLSDSSVTTSSPQLTASIFSLKSTHSEREREREGEWQSTWTRLCERRVSSPVSRSDKQNTMLTLFSSDSSPVCAHVGADDKRVPVAFDKGQHIVAHRQIRDVIPEVQTADPVIRLTVHKRAVFEPEASPTVLSPWKHLASVSPRNRQLSFKRQKRNLKRTKRKTKPKHAAGRNETTTRLVSHWHSLGWLFCQHNIYNIKQEKRLLC